MEKYSVKELRKLKEVHWNKQRLLKPFEKSLSFFDWLELNPEEVKKLLQEKR